MARRYEVPEDAILYVGDDLGDLPFFLAAPFAAAPHDAAPDVLAEADFVAKVNGGRGVIAEVIREVLVAQGLWEKLLKEHISDFRN